MYIGMNAMPITPDTPKSNDDMSVWNRADFVIKAKAEEEAKRLAGVHKELSADAARAKGIILSSSEARDTTAQFLRVTTVNGDDFPVYLKAAENGDSEAMRLTAICYQGGKGIEQDLKKAWEWYGRSALLGNTEAQYDIGTLYRDGIGTKQNFQESAYWFRKAASNGHPKAMVNIARQFAGGLGVLPDQRIAAENYWRAAERGEAEGAYQFAVMLRDGKGMECDLPRALKYFEKAAEAGYLDSGIEAQKLRASGIVPPSKTNPNIMRKHSASRSKKARTRKRNG